MNWTASQRRRASNQAITIRRLSDHPRAAASLAASLCREWPQAYDPENARRFIERFRPAQDQPCLFFAAAAGAHPIGMVALVPGLDPNGDPSLILVALHVHPAYRRQGIGTMLCRRALDGARRTGWQNTGAYTSDMETFFARAGMSVATRAIVTSDRSYDPVWYMQPQAAGPVDDYSDARR